MTVGELILAQLILRPGLSTRELSDMLGKRFQHINNECAALESTRKIRVDRSQRPYRLYPLEGELEATLADASPRPIHTEDADFPAAFERIIRGVTAALGRELDGGYEIVDRGRPHAPGTLPRGTMGIYTFLYNDEFLKIGKAGPRSNARFFSQHYRADGAQSTLAKSLLADEAMAPLGLTEESVGDWIRQNTRRIDILLDERLGVFALELIEAALHYRYEPRYEGFKSQR